MWWIVVHTDDYGEHVNVDSSEEYARGLYKRLADDENVYTVELFRAQLEWRVYKWCCGGGPAPYLIEEVNACTMS